MKKKHFIDLEFKNKINRNETQISVPGREMHFVKLPNFLSIESRPFHPDTYEDELDDDSLQQQVSIKTS